MMNNRKTLLGSAIAGALLLCGASIASAQDSESVTVRPSPIQIRHLLGRMDGEVNPTMISTSEQVSYSGLDLTRASDFAELRSRVSEAAHNVCGRLADRDPNAQDPDKDRECIRDAINDAMAQVPQRPAG